MLFFSTETHCFGLFVVSADSPFPAPVFKFCKAVCEFFARGLDTDARYPHGNIISEANSEGKFGCSMGDVILV